MKTLTYVLTFALTFSLCLASSAAIADPEESPLAAGESEASVEAQAASSSKDAAEGTAETLRHKDRSSAVMDLALDGTSVETFTAGLEKVDAEATEDEYRKLMSALDFLLFYDMGAKRDKAKLYSRHSGKSPNEIIDSVTKTRNKKKSR